MTAEQEKLIKLIATLVGEAALIGLLIHYGRKHLKGLFKALKAGKERAKLFKSVNNEVREVEKQINKLAGNTVLRIKNVLEKNQEFPVFALNMIDHIIKDWKKKDTALVLKTERINEEAIKSIRTKKSNKKD